MVEEMIKSVIEKKITSDYAHVQLPAIMKAQVVRVQQSGEWWKYALKITDKDNQIDDKYPEIPDVFSKAYILSGKVVAIALLYGEMDPFILGEVKS